MIKPKVKFLKIHKGAKIPKYETAGAAGFDLSTAERFTLQPNERRTVTTGLKIKIQDGYEGQVRPRSGLAHKHGITVVNSPGTIDCDYTGELMVVLLNTGSEPVTFMCPDRIAQMVVKPVEQAVVEEVFNVEDLGSTERGSSGLGSTGT
jgi:dUTP pyrophosphatase